MGAGQSHQHDLATDGRVEFGIIIDGIPLARCYKVLPDGGNMAIDCSKCMSASVTPIGAYDADTLVPGTHVRFMRLPNGTSGTIIGVEPVYMWDPTKCYGDIISQGSNTGLKVESGPQYPFSLGGTAYSGSVDLNGGITDWSGRTPIDSMEIGEFNRASELGVMLHLDSYMSFMRADEYTGIWVFYWDGLCRVAGQQFQEWAGPTEREVYDDEGETVYYHGISVYPWEHQGMLESPYSGSSAELTADNIQNTYPWYGRIEPTNDDLQPFHRFRTYAGYLGQGQKKLLCAPDYSSSENELLYSDTYYEPVGLHEQQIALSGHWGVRSALGFTLAKRPIIPVPKRNQIVTAEDGDNSTNYMASGYYGGGSSHKVQPTPGVSGSVLADERHLFMASSVPDLHAHLFNWEGSHPFHYHENDFYLPEEGDYAHVDSNQDIPTWADLDSTSQWYLDVPGTETIQYDHRTPETSATVYKNTAYFTITDEGGVCIGDGWGSEIRMAGGCIFLECPGDVFLAPGRNVIAWGGRDICLRAHNSVDISASEADVRLKAEQNLNMLGANGGGAYGVFIESRSDISESPVNGTQGHSLYSWDVVGEHAYHTGIVMKAKNSEIVGWGRNVYLMTKMGDALGKVDGVSTTPPSQPKEGDIVLDTKGKGDIITRSEFVKHWVQCAVMHAFPDDATTRQVNFFTEDGATLCNDVFIDGDLLNYGSHLVRNDVVSCSGHYYSTAGGMVAKAGTSAACTAINSGHTYEATLRTWSTTRWGIDLNTMWYATGRPGNIDVVKSAWFDMRLTADMKAQYFTMYEARWQQMVRENGDAVPKWSENAVESNDSSEDTYPFPGKDRLTAGTAYRTVDNKLYDVSAGTAEDRGATYEATVTLDAPNLVEIDGNYYHNPAS